SDAFRIQSNLQALSMSFKLKAVPLKFIKKLQDIVLQEAESIGSSAIFECEVSPSTAIASWMKDGSNLREGPKHKFTSDGKDRKLHIADVQLSDTGEYTCVAKNAGKEITCTAKLIVEAVPKIKTTDQNLVTDAGKPFVMTVPYDAYPRADAEWFFQGAILPVQNIDTSTDRTEFRMKSPSKEDQGKYRIAVNACGRATATIDVNILGTETVD
uniref:Ig-like domain-containing protein n=1 Tax=Salarias fasciatus TaxID=181472 RepID=A0A672IA60_SALFA